jgi:hypothetical protein
MGAESFESFWSAYPRKEGKSACQKKWAQRKLDDKAAVIVAHVQRRAKEDKQWLKGYIPMPLTFLNQDRWQDEYEVDRPRQSTSRPTAQAPEVYPVNCNYTAQLNQVLFANLMRTQARCSLDAVRQAVRYRNQVISDIRAMGELDASDSAHILGSYRDEIRRLLSVPHGTSA